MELQCATDANINDPLIEQKAWYEPCVQCEYEIGGALFVCDVCRITGVHEDCIKGMTGTGHPAPVSGKHWACPRCTQALQALKALSPSPSTLHDAIVQVLAAAKGRTLHTRAIIWMLLNASWHHVMPKSEVEVRNACTQLVGAKVEIEVINTQTAQQAEDGKTDTIRILQQHKLISCRPIFYDMLYRLSWSIKELQKPEYEGRTLHEPESGSPNYKDIVYFIFDPALNPTAQRKKQLKRIRREMSDAWGPEIRAGPPVRFALQLVGNEHAAQEAQHAGSADMTAARPSSRNAGFRRGVPVAVGEHEEALTETCKASTSLLDSPEAARPRMDQPNNTATQQPAPAAPNQQGAPDASGPHLRSTTAVAPGTARPGTGNPIDAATTQTCAATAASAHRDDRPAAVGEESVLSDADEHSNGAATKKATVHAQQLALELPRQGSTQVTVRLLTPPRPRPQQDQQHQQMPASATGGKAVGDPPAEGGVEKAAERVLADADAQKDRPAGSATGDGAAQGQAGAQSAALARPRRQAAIAASVALAAEAIAAQLPASSTDSEGGTDNSEPRATIATSPATKKRAREATATPEKDSPAHPALHSTPAGAQKRRKPAHRPSPLKGGAAQFDVPSGLQTLLQAVDQLPMEHIIHSGDQGPDQQQRSSQEQTQEGKEQPVGQEALQSGALQGRAAPLAHAQSWNSTQQVVARLRQRLATQKQQAAAKARLLADGPVKRTKQGKQQQEQLLRQKSAQSFGTQAAQSSEVQVVESVAAPARAGPAVQSLSQPLQQTGPVQVEVVPISAGPQAAAAPAVYSSALVQQQAPSRVHPDVRHLLSQPPKILQQLYSLRPSDLTQKAAGPNLVHVPKSAVLVGGPAGSKKKQPKLVKPQLVIPQLPTLAKTPAHTVRNEARPLDTGAASLSPHRPPQQTGSPGTTASAAGQLPWQLPDSTLQGIQAQALRGTTALLQGPGALLPLEEVESVVVHCVVHMVNAALEAAVVQMRGYLQWLPSTTSAQGVHGAHRSCEGTFTRWVPPRQALQHCPIPVPSLPSAVKLQGVHIYELHPCTQALIIALIWETATIVRKCAAHITSSGSLEDTGLTGRTISNSVNAAGSVADYAAQACGTAGANAVTGPAFETTGQPVQGPSAKKGDNMPPEGVHQHTSSLVQHTAHTGLEAQRAKGLPGTDVGLPASQGSGQLGAASQGRVQQQVQKQVVTWAVVRGLLENRCKGHQGVLRRVEALLLQDAKLTGSWTAGT